MKIVILGAHGQIGSILYERLSKTFEVTGTSRRPSSGLLRFDPFKDNWSTLGKPDVIINCIGQIDASRNSSFSKIHLELARRITDNCGLLGNPRIINISALGASAHHKVTFLKTKGEADDYLLQFENVVVIRPSIVCTHRTMMVKKMLMLSKISDCLFGIVIVPAGFGKRMIQPVMPNDLATIVAQLCSASVPPKILNVTGPEPMSFHEILDILFEARGKKYRIVEVGKFWTDLLVKFGVSILLPAAINRQQYQLLFEDNIACPTEAEKYLGTPLRSTKDFWKQEFSYAGH